MTQHQLYDFVYEKLKENLDENELSIIHSDLDILFEIDKEVFRFYADVVEGEKVVDYIWRVGIDRYVFVENEPEENEKSFKDKWIREMTEVEDYMKYIGEIDFFNDGLNEFLMNTF